MYTQQVNSPKFQQSSCPGVFSFPPSRGGHPFEQITDRDKAKILAQVHKTRAEDMLEFTRQNNPAFLDAR